MRVTICTRLDGDGDGNFLLQGSKRYEGARLNLGGVIIGRMCYSSVLPPRVLLRK
jgi:hypothetical protein